MQKNRFIEQWECMCHDGNVTPRCEEKALAKQAIWLLLVGPWMIGAPLVLLGDEILQPWSAVERHGNALRVWNRSYQFGSGPLPDVTLLHPGKNLFAEAPYVELNGKKIGGASRISLSPRSLGKATIRGTGHQTSWIAELEYGGFCWIKLTLREGLKVDSLKLIFPFREEIARVIADPDIAHEAMRTHRTHAPLAEKNGTLGWWFGDSVDERSFRQEPCWWVGTEEAGFAVMFEHDANWVFRRRRPVDRVVHILPPVRGRRNMVFHLINKTVTAPTDVVFEFGVCATPVRPRTQGYRSFRLGRYRPPNKYAIFSGWGNGPFWEMGTSLPTEDKWDKNTRERWERNLRINKGVFVYTAAQCTAHELADRHSHWYRLENGKPIKTNTTHVCVGAKGYVDFVCDELNRQFHRYDASTVKGLYVDTAVVHRCNNPAHGHGAYQDAFGRTVENVWRVRQLRSFFRRLHAICQKHERLLIIHTHDRIFPGVQTWCDYSAPGEDSLFDVMKNPHAYTDLYPLDYWRYHHRMGTPPLFLPQILRALQKGGPAELDDPLLSRSIIGLLAVHDITLFALQMHPAIAKSWGDSFHAWLDDGVQFSPYWKQAAYPQKDGLLISYYEKRRGDRRIVVYNCHPQKRTLDIGGKDLQVPPRNFLLLDSDFQIVNW